MLKNVVLFLLLNTATNIVHAVKPSTQKVSQEQNDSEKKEDNEDDSSFEAKNKQKISKKDENGDLNKFSSTSLSFIPTGIQDYSSDLINMILVITPSTSEKSDKTELKQIQSTNEVINSVSSFYKKNKNSDLNISFLIQLPFNVFPIIYQYLNQTDKKSLSKTCKHLNYHFNLIDPIVVENKKISKTFLSFLKRRSPFLGQLNLSNLSGIEDLSNEFIKTELKNVKLENLKYLRINGKNNLHFVLELIRILNEGNSNNLTHLEFSHIYSFDKDEIIMTNLFEIIKSKRLLKLSSLTLNDNLLNANIIDMLTHAIQFGCLPNLTHLDISWNSIRIEELNTLTKAIQSGNLSKLTHLSVSGNNFRVEGLKVLAQLFQSKCLPNLTHLNISVNQIGDEGLKVLVQIILSGGLPNLTHLDISKNFISDEGLKVLAQAILRGRLKNFTHLDISWNQIGGEGLIALVQFVQLGGFQNLTHLNMAGNNIGDEGLKVWAQAILSGGIPNFTHLNMAGNNIGDEGFKVLVQAILSGGIPNFTHLNMAGNNFADMDLIRLSQAIHSRGHPNFSYLDIVYNQIRPELSKALAKANLSGAINLTHLN